MGSKPSSIAVGTDPNSVQQQQQPKKKSLYRRYEDAKMGRNNKWSDEDRMKYTGMTKDEMDTWAETAPGVGKNQLSGKVNMGAATGIGGLATTSGYGGWGPDANGGLKFPPKPPQQQRDGKLDDDQDSD